ncbi:hypothetical protein [Amycolatopsis sp. NPDC059657]|uniref:hypothetical protein n=1 Tax=Amycolatopsis sp. NPDC059657 TaxID=3346899 RepID=UPI00366F314F
MSDGGGAGTTAAIVRREIRWQGLLGCAVTTLALWVLSNWEMWGWVYGIGVIIVLALPGMRKIVPEAWSPLIALIVVMCWLTSVTEVVQWGIAYGLGILAVSIANLVRKRFSWGEWVPYATLAIGAGLFVTSTTVAIVNGVHHSDDLAAQYAADHEYQVAKLRPRSPRGVVSGLMSAAVQDDPKRGCFLFDPTSAAQFAAAHGAPDCTAAIGHLRSLVQYPKDWINNMWIPADAEAFPSKNLARLDACRLTFDSALFDYHPNPGPQLGKFTMTQQYGQGWLVTAYEPCPKQ